MTTPTPPSHKGRHFAPVVLTPTEVRALIDATPATSASGIRLRALIAVLYGSGIRIGEALALVPADVRDGQLFVQHGKGTKRKGTKPRTVGLGSQASNLLDVWLERRKALGLNGRHPIFATYSSNAFGKAMQQRDVRHALQRAATRAGLDTRVHPHAFRHSHAFELARSRPMHVVQEQLGHSSLATTGAYLRHVSASDLSDAADDITW